jgi:hypothetical protein
MPETTTTSTNTKYRDQQGRIVYVTCGIGSGDQYPHWGSFRRKANGISIQRVKTKFLPMRDTPEDAQADLDAYAARKGWQPITQEPSPA